MTTPLATVRNLFSSTTSLSLQTALSCNSITFSNFTTRDETLEVRKTVVPSLVIESQASDKSTTLQMTFFMVPNKKNQLAGRYQINWQNSPQEGFLCIGNFTSQSMKMTGHLPIEKAPADRSDEITLTAVRHLSQ